MSTTYADIYDQLVKATADTPGPSLDQDLRALYQRHPATFTAKAKSIIDGWHAGRITSPWAFLRTELQRVDEARTTTEAAAPERTDAIRLAETWIRNAGLYAPLSEALAELYDRGGRLEPWHTDEDLRQRIADLWHHEQPRVEANTHANTEFYNHTDPC